MAATHSCEHEYSDTDAAGNCKAPGCFYNSDDAYEVAVLSGEDVYGFVPEPSDEERAEMERFYEEGM